MSGTRDGGIAAARTNKQRYGDDFYIRNGAKGGKKSKGGGFSSSGGRELARRAGAVGGTVSRRSRVRGIKPEHESTCTFCHLDGHSAYTCVLRANAKQRKQYVLSRRAYVAEQHEESRSKLKRIAEKWAKR